MADSKKRSFLDFGRYEGVWKDEQTGFECEVVIDENNFKPFKDEYPYSFEGFLEWRSTVVPNDERMKKGLNKLAMERVRGFYFNFKEDEDHKNGQNEDKRKHEMV